MVKSFHPMLRLMCAFTFVLAAYASVVAADSHGRALFSVADGIVVETVMGATDSPSGMDRIAEANTAPLDAAPDAPPSETDGSAQSNTAPLGTASRVPLSATPATLPILATLPDTATFALAFPPVPALCGKLLALSARFPEDAERVVLANTLLKAALGDAGPAGLNGLAAFLTSKGFAADAPCGLFIDLSVTAEDAADVVRKCAKAAQEKTLTPAMSYHPPAMLGMFGVSNPETAEAAAREILLRYMGPVPQESGRGETESSLHWIGDDVAYCAKGGWMYVTNSERLFRSTLAKQAAPDAVRYGAPTYPTTEPDDVVLLTRLDRLTGSMPDLLAMLSYAGRMSMFLNWPQATQETEQRFRDFYAPKTGTDPLITTLSIGRDRVGVTSRLDLAAHPRFARAPVSRPRSDLSRYIHSGSVFSAYVDWGDSLIAALDDCVPLVPMEVHDYYVEAFRRVITQFARGETAVSIHAGSPPVVRLFTAVGDPGEAEGLLRRYLDEASIPGLGRRAWHAALGSLDVYGTLEGGVFVASNVKEQLSVLCDMVRTGGGEPFHAYLDPPLIPGEPLCACSLTTSPIESLSSSLMDLGIQSSVAYVPWFRPVREIRAGKTVDGSWQTQFLTLYLNP